MALIDIIIKWAKEKHLRITLLEAEELKELIKKKGEAKKMIPVKKLIEQLKNYDGNALAYGYEGELNAIVIVEKEEDGHGQMVQLGVIDTQGMDIKKEYRDE